MSAVAFLQKLLDAGLSLSDAMTAAAAYEEATAVAAPTRSKGAIRQARYEERQRQKASENVSADASDAPDVSAPSLSPPPQTPPPHTHPRGEIYNPRAKAGPKALAESFAAFWAAYPKRKAKDAAERAFSKAMARIDDADPLAVILAGVERAMPGWDDPQFIPHPATWLNAGSWDDDPPAPRPLTVRPANDRPNAKLTARHDNYDASWAGSEQASDLLASRRAL